MDIAKIKKKGERHIPMNSVSAGASFSSSELEILFFETGSSSGSSRTSSDPSEDKSTSGPRVAELGMEERVTTSEEPSFVAWDRAAKGSLVKMTRGVVGEAVSV